MFRYEVPVVKVVVHEGYKPGQTGNDIALLKLGESFQIKKR